MSNFKVRTNDVKADNRFRVRFLSSDEKKAAAEAQKKAANPYAYALNEQIKSTPASEFALKAATGGTLWDEKHTNPLGSEYIPAAAYEKQQADLRKSLVTSDAAKRYNDIILKKQKEYDAAFQQYADENVKTPLMAPNDFGALAADSILRTRNLVKKSATQYETTKDWPTAALSNLYSLLETEGEEKALDYAKQVNAAIRNKEFRELGEKHPLLATVVSVPLNFASGYEHMFNVAEFVGEKLGGNKNAKLERSIGADMTNAFRQGVADKVDWNIGEWDAFDFIYNTGMSAVDSVLTAATHGKVAPIVLGLAAAAQTTNDILDRGGTNEQAFWGGVAAGAFESVFEKISIGNLESLKEVNPKTFKDALLNIAKSMGVNASEEGATEAANILWDTFVNKDISNAQLLLQQYRDAGMSESEAKMKVALDLGLQIAEAAASGGLMGFGFGTVGNASGYVRNKAIDRFNSQMSNIFDIDGREYSIELDTEGKPFVQVKEDIFAENDGKSVAAVIADTIKTKFNNLINVNGQNIQINKTTNDEWRRSKSANSLLKNTPVKYQDKLKAIANADEILATANDWVGEQISHERTDDIVEFARGFVDYKVGDNGYSADVLVGIRENGAAVLYNLVNVYEKQITAAPVTRASQGSPRSDGATVTNETIPQPAPVVNPNSQVQEMPMFSEPDLTTAKPQTFEESAMANIIGGDAQLTDGQRRVNSIARLLKMEPVWDVVGDPEVVGKGYFENGVIHLNKQAPALTTVYLHEFCHRLQRSGNWNTFVSFARNTPAYAQWICEKGGSNDFTTAEANYKAQIKKAYESKTGSAYNDTRLANEIMARFISEKMMVEYASGQNTDLATATEHFLTEIAKNRKWYHIVMDWINEMINRLARRTEQADFLKFQRMLKQAYNDVQSRAATADTGREYDIITLDSGKSYVKASRKIIFGDNVSEWRKQISAFFNKALENGPIYINTIEGDALTISKETADKARDINISENGITRKLTHNEFLVKLHAESHIDELAEISTKNNKGKIVPDAKNHSFAKDGFTYRTVYFEDFDGTYYKITLSIGQNGNVSTVYNVGKIKVDDIPNGNIVSAIGSKADMSSTNHSIRDSAENSKENFENREYSFDEDKANSEDIYFEQKKERVTDGGELRVPASVYARELLHDTDSSYNKDALIKEIKRIYAAADKGYLDEVVSLSQQTAENLIDNVEFAEYEQEERETAVRDLMRQISLHVQEETKATIRRFRLNNGSLRWRNDRLQEKNADLKSKNKELNRTHDEIHAEEREKFEAAQQRKTDKNVIAKSVNNLDKKFRANSNNKHVHESLKDAVKIFLEIFRKYSPGTFDDRRNARASAIYDRLSNADYQKFLEVKEKFFEFEDKQTEFNIDPDIKVNLQQLAKILKEKPLSELSDSELHIVRELAEQFQHLVSSANEIFIEGKREDFRALATDEAEELKKKPQKKYVNLGDGKFRQGIDKAKEFFIEGNLKPVYFFEKLSGVYKKLYDDISAGLDTTIRNIEQAKNKLQETIKKYDYWSWVDKNQKITLGSVDGVKITVTLGEAMSIIAIYEREQRNAETQGSNHLGVGGIVLKRRQIVEQIEKTAKDKNGSFETLTQLHLISAWASSPYKITESDIKEIKKQLGKEKLAFIDELVEYMSTVGSALGNEASNKLYGTSKFNEPYYFPFETSKKFLAREFDARKGNKTLTNRSFTKNTVEEATSPLVISDFMEVFCKHMTEMCEYNGLAVPLNNLKRVCGFVDKGDEKRAGFALMNELERVHGKAAVSYLDAFIKSVDGGVEGQQAGDSLTGSLISLFQKNAVAANLSVVIQQPSSIMRAVAYIEPKYLFAKGAKFTKEAWEECKQHNSIAIQKEMGRFDIGNPKSTFDYMTDRQYKGLKDKAKGFVKDENYRDNLLSKAASKADQYTWCTIWNGCKAKIEATTDFEVGSEQFFAEAEKLFKEVIEHTQVYDSVLSRSQNMRSQSMLTRMATAFTGEPTTNLNMLHKALWDAKAGNMGAATKGVIGVFSATLLNAILKSLITAMRDDDEDKSYGEKYITEVGGNFLSDANPIGWVPIMKDVLSIFEGYQVKRADMNLVQDLYYGLSALSSTKKTTWEKILAVANPVSAMCGLPVENVARDIGSVINTVTTAVNDENEHTHGFKYAVLEGLPGEDSYAKYYEIMRDKQKKGDTQGYTELKEYLMGRGKTEKEIESGVKAAYSKSKPVAKQTDDYFAKLAQNALFGKLPEEKQADVKTAVKRYLTESAINAATGKEMSKTNQKAAEAQKNGSSAVNYFLAKASFEDTDNSGGISNEEKIAAINKMNISAFEKQALIMLYTKK